MEEVLCSTTIIGLSILICLMCTAFVILLITSSWCNKKKCTSKLSNVALGVHISLIFLTFGLFGILGICTFHEVSCIKAENVGMFALVFLALLIPGVAFYGVIFPKEEQRDQS